MSAETRTLCGGLNLILFRARSHISSASTIRLVSFIPRERARRADSWLFQAITKESTSELRLPVFAVSDR